MGKYRGQYKKLVQDGYVRKYTEPEEPKFFETKDFRELHKKWHGKLETSKFFDHEEFDSPMELMKVHENERFRGMYTGDEFLAQQRYYELAGQLLHDHSFKNQKEQNIWKMHAEGFSIKDIAKKLKTTNHHVSKLIKELRKKIIK